MNFRLRSLLRYAFLFPGVNSRAELVPSHGASRRWLGESIFKNKECVIERKILEQKTYKLEVYIQLEVQLDVS